MTPAQITIDSLRFLYDRLGVKIFEGAYNMNHVGIRSASKEVDKFNDILVQFFQDEKGNWVINAGWGTTKPGLGWLAADTTNPNGTFILIPGVYKGCWEIRKHQGKYDALCQKAGYAGFKGFRDKNKNGKIEFSGTVYSDVAGLNMHTENLNLDSKVVGKYSAACQVWADTALFLKVMANNKKAITDYKYKNSFSYFLAREEDIV